MLSLNKNIVILANVAIVMLSSCRVPQKVIKKEQEIMPSSYSASITDTFSIGSLKYKEFFNDPLLIAIIDEVLVSNFDQRIALEQLKIGEAGILARKGAFLPTLQAGLQASGTHYGKHTIEGVGNFDTNLSPNIEESQKINTKFSPNYWLGLSANWEVDVWGKLSSLKKSAQARYFATKEGQHLLQSALVTQAASLYYELITLDKNAAILKQNIDLQKRALEIVEIQKEVGRATELAVQQFIAQQANTEAAWVAIQQQTIQTENQLLALMGKMEGNIQRAAKIEKSHLYTTASFGKPELLLQLRPDIKTSYFELEATHADAKAARAAFFPTIGISAYGAFNTFNGNFMFNPTSLVYQLLGNIAAPVFQQHQLKSQFKIASAQQEIAFFNYQKTVLAAFQEVRTLAGYIDNNVKILSLKEKEVTALTNSIEVSNDLYVSGYANYLEIIAAQKSKIVADLDLIQARKNQALAMVQLYKALGGGWQ